LFAATNVFRVGLIKKYKLNGFELSQSYLFFWDKLEKANFFLERMFTSPEFDIECG
jgi:bleomycin hydrolase